MRHRSEPFFFCAALLLINALIIVWCCLDYTLPVYDMAMHLLSGLHCRDLLLHPHLRSNNWWQGLLAVNPLYPPFVYLVYGLLKLIFGPQRWVDILVHCLFCTVLFSSVYGIGRLIFKNAASALLAAVIIFTYPSVFLFAHCDMLDMPGLAMVALSLFCFTWW